MSFWGRLSRTRRRPAAGQSLRLKLTRLRRLNRCYREFLGLFVDAAEKQGEGFILDRQYIISLAERVFRLGYEIVFHSNVLCPGSALGGYAALDRLKVDVRGLSAGKRRPPEGHPTVRMAEKDGSVEGAVGHCAAAAIELRGRPVGSAPAPEVSSSRLREARRHKTRLIEHEGYVACPGVSSGRVWPVQSEADLHALPGHGVLVARRLEPTAALLRTLPRVAAILVEEATPGDRIAALARSFRVPALLGVAGVTARLPPGALVTVDATDAVVYSGFFEELISHHVLHSGGSGEEPEYRLLNAVLRELGSPLPAGTLSGAAPEGRQTLCETVEGAYGTTLCQLVADLWPGGGGSPMASPGLAEEIRTVNLSAPHSKAEPEAAGVFGRPGPPAWVLAGLLDDENGGTISGAPDARGLLVASYESVTVLLSAGGRVVMLEAVAVGGARGNHAMVCARDTSEGSGETGEGLDRLYAEAVRLGLVAVRAPRTSTAWREGIPPESVQELLTRVGELGRRATLDTWAQERAAGRG